MGQTPRMPDVGVMIVVATVAMELDRATARLNQLGVRDVQVFAPNTTRRVLVGAVDDEAAAGPLAMQLRSEGMLATTRPNAGVRLAAWRRRTAPVTFGDRLTVCFAWSEDDRCDMPGVIELGAGGFGSGDHPTTRLLIEQLMQRILGGERVLDVGCGSGVLALAALELGAASAVGVDIDPAAVEATRAHAALNGMADRMVATSGPLEAVETAFDVVLANIARGAIVELAADLVRLVAPGGWLAVSGISPSQCSQVGDFLRPLVEIDRCTEGEWSTLVVARPC